MKLSITDVTKANGFSKVNGLDKTTAETDLDSGDCATNSEALDTPTRLPRLISRHNVISRKDNLILSPEVNDVKDMQDMHEATEADHADIDLVDSACTGDNDNRGVDKILARKIVSAATFQREFDLSDVLDYVKTGVACIIEDEVTQRFEAEELKSWNLLTRTNDKFTFINWRLTFFYYFGCVFRYCFLLPGRIAILIVGVCIPLL